MAFDRSKFKSTSVATAKQADKAVEAVTGKGDRGPSADYHKIKPGMNYHRLYPPHPEDGGELYAVPKGVHWIPQEVPKKDKEGKFIKDAKDKFIMEVATRPLFNAKIHGGFKKDIIEEYIAFATKVSEEMYPDSMKNFDTSRKTYMEPIIGGFGSKHKGIMLRQSWVAYSDNMVVDNDGAVKSKVLGRLEIGKAVRFRLNSLAATEAGNDPLGTDPFTDPEDGRAICINYNDKAQKPADYYATEMYAPLIPGAKGQIRLYPLSDDDLTKFEAFPSLKKMFINVYDRKAFDNAMKGLKIFDDEQELGIFAYEEFLDICGELSDEIPEDGSTPSQSSEEEEEGDDFANMDRDELKAYIRENKLNIIPNKTLNDDAIRDKIREALLTKEEEETGEEEEEESGEPEVEVEKVDKKAPVEAENDSKSEHAGLPFKVEEKGSGVSQSAKEKIQAMKDKAAAKKKA
jgi:hypothetical protein